MDSELRQKLEKNIVKYAWYKIFTKRVYLPLVAIQLVNEGQVTLAQIAIIATVATITELILQLPTGYVADKWGNRGAMIMGASVSLFGPLLYIFWPSFIGGMLAAVLFFGGRSFISGSGEAFIHDTLKALSKDHQYSKVMGRSQSYGLMGNIVLITAVPATYAIHPAMPFAFGFLAELILLYFAAVSFTYPSREHAPKKRNMFTATKNVLTKQNIALFVFAGVLGGIAHRSQEFRELLLQDQGVPVAWFGAILAIGSVIGAVLGFYTHTLDKLPSKVFYLFDVCLLSGCLMLVGTAPSIWLMIAGLTIFVGYSRIRQIVFQSKLLKDITHVYKASLLSTLSLFSIFGGIAVVNIVAYYIETYGLKTGHFYAGLSAISIGLVLWIILITRPQSKPLQSTS